MANRPLGYENMKINHDDALPEQALQVVKGINVIIDSSSRYEEDYFDRQTPCKNPPKLLFPCPSLELHPPLASCVL
jgi:hypothetical protein